MTWLGMIIVNKTTVNEECCICCRELRGSEPSCCVCGYTPCDEHALEDDKGNIYCTKCDEKDIKAPQ